MTETDGNKIDLAGVFTRFPAISEDSELKADKTNPAIRLYGRRFYKDQTPIEYLAEFLLVFASPKNDQDDNEKNGSYRLKIDANSSSIPRYYPQDQVALKLFAFFPSSKLETRHQVHRNAYLDALETIKDCLTDSNQENKDETIRLIQSLLNGFVGVAKNRTWATHSFLPVSTVFLARELDWLNSKAIKDSTLETWQNAEKYFTGDRHNFMGRGGEILFLQLANLFSDPNASPELFELCNSLQKELSKILKETIGSVAGLITLIEKKMEQCKLKSISRHANLGWVPAASRTEALLFAKEMDNICTSNLGGLEKIDLLKTLCCMQVLRSLCFQARRLDNSGRRTADFIGQYAWIVADSETKTDAPIRQMAQNSFNHIEGMLYRVLRKKEILDLKVKFSVAEGDKHGFSIFRKIAKEIGLVIPKTGGGQRFTLHQGLLRFLVAALIKPGERIRLNHFYQRVFAHYGIALGGQELAIALAWIGNESGSESYAVSANTAWIEEALQQGGFLVELSDAVSIVHNPG